MKTKLALASLVLLASIGTASAHGARNITFDGYCDGMALTTSSIYSVGTMTGCDTGVAEGFKAKISGITYLILSDNIFGASYATTYLLQYPLRTGGAFYIYDTTDGITQTQAFAGTYTLGAPSHSAKVLKSFSQQK